MTQLNRQEKYSLGWRTSSARGLQAEGETTFQVWWQCYPLPLAVTSGYSTFVGGQCPNIPTLLNPFLETTFSFISINSWSNPQKQALVLLRHCCWEPSETYSWLHHTPSRHHRKCVPFCLRTTVKTTRSSFLGGHTPLWEYDKGWFSPYNFNSTQN